MEKIDFVVLWVDGNDSEWLEQKNKYMERRINDINNMDNRFRDWELLKYWFRGIEKNAPWVNRIHFVTYGHLPSWLDTTNPKLNIVNHKDIIPEEYLPTFNSNVIQFYLHRIPGLTEKFVMFDDDQFIIKDTKATDFFVGDKICDVYGENIIYSSKIGDVYPHTLLNNMQCINQYYSKKKVYKKNFFKYFNLKYGFVNNFRSLCLLPWSNFNGIYSPHICQAYTKKYYELFWKYCKEQLEECSKNRFRKRSDYTTFLIRYLELVEGDFVPRKESFGKRLELGENNSKIYEAIKKQKYHVLCINDSNIKVDYQRTKEELKKCFESILPEKSSFEK